MGSASECMRAQRVRYICLCLGGLGSESGCSIHVASESLSMAAELGSASGVL